MSKETENSDKADSSFSTLKTNIAKDPTWNEQLKSNPFAINEGMSSMLKLNQDLKKSWAMAAFAAPLSPTFEKTALQAIIDDAHKAKSLYSSNLSEIADVAEQIHNNFRSIMKATELGASLKTFNLFSKHNSALKAIQESLTSSDSMIELFRNASRFSELSERSLNSFAWEKLGSQISLQQKPKTQLSSVFGGLNNSYFTLFHSFEKNPLSFTNINPSITKLIPSEYYTGSNLLKVISVKKEDAAKNENIEFEELSRENETALQLYLPKVKNGLLRMWNGAVQTLDSNNIDKERHFIVSLRELFTHLMHELAPDNGIKKWSQNPKHYTDKKNPTRRARLEYIYRNIQNKEFGNFFNKDIEATLAFIDIFQKATHDADNNFTDQQLFAIKVKAETTLNFMLEIHFKSL